MSVLKPLMLALSTFTALPLPRLEYGDKDAKRAMCYLPLAGLLVGLCWWGWFQLAELLRLGNVLRASGLVLVPLLVTGGIHMDGFLDTSDALSSWQPKERKLEILKDTHVGAFAVIRTGMYLVAMLGLYSELGSGIALPLALGFVLSRCLAMLMNLLLPNARGSGMLSSFQEGQNRNAVMASAALFAGAAVLAGIFLNWLAMVAGLAALLVLGLWFQHMARSKFGGITGDLAGYLVQWAELAFALGVWIGGKLL